MTTTDAELLRLCDEVLGTCGHLYAPKTIAAALRDRLTASSAPVDAAEREAMGTGEAISFLDSMAQYFEYRDAGGEDRAVWANLYNAENCRKIVALLRGKAEASVDVELRGAIALVESWGHGWAWNALSDKLQQRTLAQVRAVIAAVGSGQAEASPLAVEIEEIRKRHVQAIADIQNNCGAAYSSRIMQDSYSIHDDRAKLLAYIAALPAATAVAGMTPDALKKAIYSATAHYEKTIGLEAMPMIVQDVQDAIMALLRTQDAAP